MIQTSKLAQKTFKLHQVQALKYDFDALEPVMSTTVVQFLHKKFLREHTEEANRLLKHDDQNLYEYHYGAHVNLTGFLDNLSAARAHGGMFLSEKSELTKAIKERWGCYQKFMYEFTRRSENVPQNGWSFLVADGNSLYIQTLPGHEMVTDGNVLMFVNLWDEAYQFDYGHDRKTYLKNLWRIIDWRTIEQRYLLTKTF